jgi:putative flippase GtrA
MEEIQKRLTVSTVKPVILKYGQFLKFCIVGAANTLISLVVYYLLIKFFGLHYLLSSVMAYCTGLLNGYIFSSTFVFQQKRNVKQGVKFIGVNTSSLLINLLILYLLVEVSGVSSLLSQLFATIFNVIYNFSLNKWWTFK